MSVASVAQELMNEMSKNAEVFQAFSEPKRNTFAGVSVQDYETKRAQVLSIRKKLVDLIMKETEPLAEWKQQIVNEQESSFVGSSAARFKIYSLLYSSLR